MSDNFYKRLSLVFGFLVLAEIFGLLIFIANLEIKDLDLWLHLGVGRTIVQNHFQVPQVDILSCTIAGKPWINHEWLFQVIVFYLYRAFGPEGLITMQVMIVALTMLVLFILGYRRDKQLASIFVLLLVALVYQQRFTIRPDLYSLFFFALYILILSFFLENKRSILALFVIQVLWTNMHGFFFFGPLFVGVGLLAEWLKRKVPLPYQWNHISRLNDIEYRRLKKIFFVVILACLLNPLFIEGAWYPVKVFFQLSGESRVFFERIIELKRPIMWGNILSQEQYPYYKLLILISFVSFVFNRRKIDLGVLIFWLIFLFFSLAAVRNMIYFAFAAYLAFMNNCLGLSLKDLVPLRVTDKKFQFLTSTVIKIFLAFWVLQYWTAISMNGYFDFDTYERKSEFGGVSLRTYPDKAVDFLVQNRVRGNFFNDFNTGAYLVGRCFPDIKVFIDGRTEVYGPQFFKYYQELWEKENKDKFKDMLNKYQITGIILSSVFQPIPVHALEALVDLKEWIPVYFDYDALIYLKDVPQNRDVIDKNRLDLSQWQAKKMDLLRLGAKNVTPYQNINRAYTFLDLRLYDQAMAEAQAALDVDPGFFEPYKILGKAYVEKKDMWKAFTNFRIATVLAPQDNRNRMNLAKSYYDLGQYPYAVEQFQKIIERDPKDPRAYFLISRAWIKIGKFEESLKSVKQGFLLDPKSVADVLKIGDMLGEAQQLDLAKKIYDMALTGKDNVEKVHLKLGNLFLSQGDSLKAREEFEKGLKIAPQDQELKNQLIRVQGNAVP